ncbi:hypothetical protein LJB80_01090 [Bacteroides sp. OttesenSCG-928-F21]|nr:hypothetical protein [Bacteroides sp. OttesenSCG-928-F21]
MREIVCRKGKRIVLPFVLLLLVVCKSYAVERSPWYPAISASGKLLDPGGRKYDIPLSIKAYCGDIINAIGLVYEANEIIIGNESGELKTFELKEGEYITGVSGKYGQFTNNNVTFFTEIQFVTNLQDTLTVSSGLAKRTNEKTFSYQVKDESMLYCLYGTETPFINSIGFYEENIEAINEVMKEAEIQPVEEESSSSTVWIFVGIGLVLLILLALFVLKKRGYRF